MTIKHLVISGGGPNILQIYGGLKYANIKNIWTIDNIETIHATSAGTVISLLFMLKIPIEDIDNYFINRPWYNIFHISPQHFLQLFNKTGIFSIKVLSEFLNPLFKSVDCDCNITLQQLYERTNIKFYSYTSCLEEFDSRILSYTTVPDMRIIEAIYASISIPCLFEPMLYKNKHYFDGGLFTNYPLDKCIELLETTNTTFHVDEILGICGNNNKYKPPDIIEEDTIEAEIHPLKNIFEYFFEFIKKMINYCGNTNKHEIKYEIKMHFIPFTLTNWNDLITSKQHREENIHRPIKIIDNLIESNWEKTNITP